MSSRDDLRQVEDRIHVDEVAIRELREELRLRERRLQINRELADYIARTERGR